MNVPLALRDTTMAHAMKMLLPVVAALGLIVTATPALAAPIPLTWGPDVYDPVDTSFNPDGGVPCTAASLPIRRCISLSWSHNLVPYGFVPGASSNIRITGGVLELFFYDETADPNEPYPEKVNISLDSLALYTGMDANTTVTLSNFSMALLLSLQNDGILNVSIERQHGDYLFDKSIFTATGEQLLTTDDLPTAALPEPGSFLLLGTGVVALAAKWRSRRQEARA